MNIWSGMFLFVMLAVLLVIESVCIFGCVVEIPNSSGWNTFWLTVGLLAMIAFTLFTIWLGGDQLYLGFHMYG